MTFAAFETTDGSPIELLTFQNGAQSFLYSNTIQNFTLGARTFVPLAYRRSKFAQSKDSDDNNITLTAPGDFEVAELFNGILTSNITTCKIERIHSDDPDEGLQVLWQGRVVALTRKGDQISVLLQPLSSGAESTPRRVFSSLCNAFLFESPGCLLIRNDWRFDGTISGISADGLEITVNGLRVQAAALDAVQGGPTGPLTSGELDIYWQGGYIEMANGEIRDVVEGNFGGDPDVFRTDIPFRSVATSDACTVYAGCSLTRGICDKKFANVLNFQGFPDIPEIDPANTELPPGSSQRPNTFAGA